MICQPDEHREGVMAYVLLCLFIPEVYGLCFVEYNSSYGLICCFSTEKIGLIVKIREIIFGILPKSEKNIIEMNNSIAAVILTKNEEKHIVRCLESLKGVCDDVVVVDCFSEDRTEELAKEHGARVIG